MNSAAQAPSSGRDHHVAIPVQHQAARSRVMVSLPADAPYTSAKWALISPVASPRLARPITPGRTMSTSHQAALPQDAR